MLVRNRSPNLARFLSRLKFSSTYRRAARRHRGERPIDAGDDLDLGDKGFERRRAVEKASFAVHDELRDARDRGRENQLAVRHGLHQDQRQTLAMAGEHDQITGRIKRIELRAAEVARKA